GNRFEHSQRGSVYLRRRLGFLLIFALILGAAIPAALRLLNPGFSAGLEQLPFWAAGVPFLGYLLIYGIDAVRLRLVLRPLGVLLKPRDCLINSVLGIFYSGITPMAAGGQPFQIWHLVRRGVPSPLAGAVILVRFAEYMLLSLLLSLLGALLYLPHLLELAGAIPYGLAGLAAGLLIYLTATLLVLASVCFPQRVAGSLLRRTSGPSQQKKSKGWRAKVLELCRSLITLRQHAVPQLWLDFLLGGVNLLLQAASLYFLLNQIANIDFSAVLCGFVLLNSVVYFIPTPGGSGGIEGSYALFFSTLAAADVSAAVIVWRLGSYYLHLGLQILVLIVHARRKNAHSFADIVL
ncbi:MAG: lysylphosphatidylglycerol synthase transmembrane domain-containing protein, partial [Spirochaetota bacterium]